MSSPICPICHLEMERVRVEYQGTLYFMYRCGCGELVDIHKLALKLVEVVETNARLGYEDGRSMTTQSVAAVTYLLEEAIPFMRTSRLKK